MDYFRIVDLMTGFVFITLTGLFSYIIKQKDKEVIDIKKSLLYIQQSYVSKSDVLNFILNLEHKVDRLDAKLERLFERILDSK